MFVRNSAIRVFCCEICCAKVRFWACRPLTVASSKCGGRGVWRLCRAALSISRPSSGVADGGRLSLIRMAGS
jgi:hypothetical protein